MRLAPERGPATACVINVGRPGILCVTVRSAFPLSIAIFAVRPGTMPLVVCRTAEGDAVEIWAAGEAETGIVVAVDIIMVAAGDVVAVMLTRMLPLPATVQI